MRLPCKTKIEKFWLVVSLSILFLHGMLEASSPGYYSLAFLMQRGLELAMVVLSFPLGGLVMLVLQDATHWCDGCADLAWMLDCATLLLAGYIQWFWVLPEILRGREPTFINLRQRDEIVLPETAAASSPASSAHAVTQVLAPAAESLPFPPVQFDEAGLTALDRVLRAERPASHAPDASPARVELIFPAVR